MLERPNRAGHGIGSFVLRASSLELSSTTGRTLCSNEPPAEPQLERDAVWSRYLGELCRTVRDVDRSGTLIVGPRSYNSARFLGELVLPERERNLILTLHHYWPISFTMQGETWLANRLGDRTWPRVRAS